MKAVVMAGGFGTRLRPLTINTPKPMAPVGNLPMMEHVVSILARTGLKDVSSLLYFQPDSIRDYFGDGSKFGINMTYNLPSDDLGTAGAVKYAVGDSDETVLVISGDVITTFDLNKAIEWHKKKKSEATLLLTRVENPIAFGIVITDDDGRIVRFLEKPSWGEAFSDTINTGIYLLEPSAVSMIPRDTNFDFSQNLFPLMLERGMSLNGLIMDGYWKDVGNVDEYSRVHNDIFSGQLELDLKLKREIIGSAVVYRGKNVRFGDDLKLDGTIILGDDVSIGSGSQLHDCVIGSRSYVGASCSLDDTVVWSDSQIGAHSRINRSVICSRSKLGANVQLLDDTIISDDCTIGDGATVKANCKIWPGKSVDDGATVSSSLVWGEKWNRELFTDSKVSGLALTEVTPEMAVRLGSAMGASLGQGAWVVTSRDPSDTSRLLRRGLTSGLLAAGVNVSDLQTLPVPVVRYALTKGKYDAGIHVRHNPVDYRILDFIFFHGSALDMPTAKLKKIERNYFGEDYERAGLGNIGHLDYPQRVLEDYREEFMADIDVDLIHKAGFKVVVDYSNGASAQVFPNLFSRLGISATELNANPNPGKLSSSPEEKAQAITQLSAIVRSLKADIGFLINPAAEKLSVVDENGEPIDSQMLLLLVTELFFESYGPARIAVPVAASMGVERVATEHNSEVVRVPNDHQAMMQARKDHSLPFVGGTRGGFIFPGFQIGADALLASVKILEMFARTKSRFGSRRNRFSNLFRDSVSVPCPWSKKGTVMRRLITETADKKRELVDGVRVFEKTGWVLVTPDRYRSSFNILAESESADHTSAILRDYRSFVEECQQN